MLIKFYLNGFKLKSSNHFNKCSNLNVGKLFIQVFFWFIYGRELFRKIPFILLAQLTTNKYLYKLVSLSSLVIIRYETASFKEEPNINNIRVHWDQVKTKKLIQDCQMSPFVIKLKAAGTVSFFVGFFLFNLKNENK